MICLARKAFLTQFVDLKTLDRCSPENVRSKNQNAVAILSVYLFYLKILCKNFALVRTGLKVFVSFCSFVLFLQFQSNKNSLKVFVFEINPCSSSDASRPAGVVLRFMSNKKSQLNKIKIIKLGIVDLPFITESVKQ